MNTAFRPVRLVFAALLATSALIGAPVAAFADDAAVIATVDGQTVTDADITMALQDLAQQFERVPEEQRRAAALQALIEIRLTAAKGRADGVDQSEDFKRQQAFLNDRVLHQAVIDKDVAGTVTDADIRARYDKEVADRPAENEVKARHILVKTEDEAKKLIAELDGGADFLKVASEHTTDPSGKESGGDLGWFGAGMMVPEFEKAAFELTPGSYTKTPVKSQFGFHIIKLEDKRVKQPPEFDGVKDQVRAVLIRERYVAMIEEMRKTAKVEIKDEALKKAIDEAQK
jgi:peptidyl-prolyl cis-trans isomerase C